MARATASTGSASISASLRAIRAILPIGKENASRSPVGGREAFKFVKAFSRDPKGSGDTLVSLRLFAGRSFARHCKQLTAAGAGAAAQLALRGGGFLRLGRVFDALAFLPFF